MNPAENCTYRLEEGWYCGVLIGKGYYCDTHTEVWDTHAERCTHVYQGLHSDIDARCVMPVYRNGHCEHHTLHDIGAAIA
jgi:hypothetical protein